MIRSREGQKQRLVRRTRSAFQREAAVTQRAFRVSEPGGPKSSLRLVRSIAVRADAVPQACPRRLT